MNDIEDIAQPIKDLAGVEPRSIASDAGAKEAMTWHQMAKGAIKEAEDAFKPIIAPLDKAHKDAVAKRKKFLENIEKAVARVRPAIANWIYSGHKVEGAYARTSYKITIDDAGSVPAEYFSPDPEKIMEFVKLTEGKVPVDGCTITPVAVLYAGKEKE